MAPAAALSAAPPVMVEPSAGVPVPPAQADGAQVSTSDDAEAGSMAVLQWIRWDPLPPFDLDELNAHPLRARAARLLALPGQESAAESLLRTLLRDAGAQAIDRLLLVEVLLRRGDAAGALGWLQDAAQFPPGLRGRAATIQGQLLFERGEFAAARIWADQALAAAPGAWAVQVLNGLLLSAERRWDEAILQYRRMLVRRPDLAGVRLTLAGLLAQNGRVVEGLQENVVAELFANSAQAAGQVPVWDGRLADGDQLLVVSAGAGIGDAIQMLRYLPALRARAPHARLALLTRAELVPLARTMGVFDEIGADIAPTEHRFCGQVSLAHLALFHLLEPSPAPTLDPYLGCDPERVAAMRLALEARLPTGAPGPLRVGLRWSGQPGGFDALRSVPVDRLAPLFAVPGITWIALLEGGHRDRGLLATGTLPALDLSEQLVDLVDTAALMLNLDLVITVDTSLAHLSGALGVPTWMMARPDLDRWGNEERTALYSSMRVFRHPAQRLDWDHVVSGVVAALRQRVGAGRAG